MSMRVFIATPVLKHVNTLGLLAQGPVESSLYQYCPQTEGGPPPKSLTVLSYQGPLTVKDCVQ